MTRSAASIALLSAVVLTGSACAAPAIGEGLDLRTLFNPSAPSTSAAPAPAATAGAQEWSGESGASNHPPMSPQAIRTAAANFRNCLAALRPRADRTGASPAVFDAT